MMFWLLLKNSRNDAEKALNETITLLNEIVKESEYSFEDYKGKQIILKNSECDILVIKNCTIIAANSHKKEIAKMVLEWFIKNFG